ncbi:response regulator [Cellvibrio sp. NN19]|uniref:response regulator n=1 Tax=Cellvibrio chitinivorans TaxID=3102792 RepID=UPI002B413D0E|nr:response regulator [Cellvibrio sp. NN19]
MINKRRNIKSNVWRLIFIPSISLIILIAVSLTYLCISQINKFIEMRGSVLAQKTAHLLHKPMQENNLELAQYILNAAIEEPYIRAIHVYNNATNSSFHSGPQFMKTEDAGEPNLQQPLVRKTYRSLRFAHPLVDLNNKNPIGWIEVELSTAPYAVVRYEAIVLTIALTLLCLIIGAYFAISLYYRITEPLDHIKNVVHALARGRLNERVEQQNSSEFLGLAESINTMADYMEAAQADMQSHIDHAIEDLRETLETIEIQNVELDLARKEALEASRVKSEFLANTSHEIRTPLNGILGFINLALKTDLNEQQREYMETIRDSAQNLLTVINGILDFSKIESGKLTLDYAPVPIRNSVDEVLHMLAPDAHEKHLEVISHVESSIPKNLLGDALRFKQVLSNLVSNAIKYSSSGNILIDVSTMQQQETQIILKVCVSDEGIGLTREEQEQLFSPFNQADTSSTREHEGTGLGLAICKGLVERMHGEIGVVSEPEQGSTFWFTARMGIDKRQPSLSQLANLSDYRILVCGENPASLKQINSLLREWNGNTESIAAIHDCFPILRSARNSNHNFDLLILDIAPSERKIPPVLLNNLAEQLHMEFNCTLVACCTPAHQRLFRAHSDKSQVLFVNKPIAYDALLQTLGRQLDLHIKDMREQDEEDALRPSVSVLLVDDNLANLQLASELLRGLNLQVVQANSGKQAIEACSENLFDVIFMDIQMPGMDGMEATRHIRALEQGKRRTPIIALTAHTITEQKAELLIAGMDDCISKPVNEAQLAHIINRWASLSGKKEVIIPNEDRQQHQPVRETIPTHDLTGSVDIQLCLKLANNKPALARDMLSMLLGGLENEKQQIAAALAENNFEELGELIHRLYGSSCYCGVPRLKHISGLLDKLFQSKQYEQTRDAIPALNHALDDLMKWGKDKDLDLLFGLEKSPA